MLRLEREAARHCSTRALSYSRQGNAEFRAALVLALVRDTGRGETIAAELAKRYPLDTCVAIYGVPSVRAAIELSRNNPAKAVQALESRWTGTPLLSGRSNHVGPCQ